MMTGDLPTPIKYFNSEIHGAYKQLEDKAADKLLHMLPEPLSPYLAPYVKADAASYEYKLVKAADKLSAYIKCLEELKSGNDEFKRAKESIEKELREKRMPLRRLFHGKLYPRVFIDARRNGGSGMNKVRITVLKTTLDKELAKEYGVAGLGPCPMLKAGQVFYADYAKPARALRRSVESDLSIRVRARRTAASNSFTTATGSRRKGRRDLLVQRRPSAPLIFKLECTDIQAKAGE